MSREARRKKSCVWSGNSFRSIPLILLWSRQYACLPKDDLGPDADADSTLSFFKELFTRIFFDVYMYNLILLFLNPH